MHVQGNAIAFSGEDVVVDAALAAEHLGLSTELFWRNMRQGIVYGVVERGEGEDLGRVRITLRCRSRSWSTIIAAKPDAG